MKIRLIVLVGVLLVYSISYAQDENTYLQDLKEYRKGDGNCTFSMKVNKLQTFFTHKQTVKDFENSLCSWQAYGTNVKLYHTWNEKTKEHDIPLFTDEYMMLKNGFTAYNMPIKITFGLDKIIQSISFRVGEDILLDKIIPQLKSNGYSEDRSSTRLANRMSTTFGGSPNKIFYKNASKGITVVITIINENNYEIKMYK